MQAKLRFEVPGQVKRQSNETNRQGVCWEIARMLPAGKEVKGWNGIIYRRKEPAQVSELEGMIGFIWKDN